MGPLPLLDVDVTVEVRRSWDEHDEEEKRELRVDKKEGREEGSASKIWASERKEGNGNIGEMEIRDRARRVTNRRTHRSFIGARCTGRGRRRRTAARARLATETLESRSSVVLHHRKRDHRDRDSFLAFSSGMWFILNWKLLPPRSVNCRTRRRDRQVEALAYLAPLKLAFSSNFHPIAGLDRGRGCPVGAALQLSDSWQSRAEQRGAMGMLSSLEDALELDRGRTGTRQKDEGDWVREGYHQSIRGEVGPGPAKGVCARAALGMGSEREIQRPRRTRTPDADETTGH